MLAVLLGVSSIFLMLTYTRSALVGTVLGIIVVGLLQERRLFLVLVIGLMLFVALDPRLGTRFTELQPADRIVTADPTNSLEWRFTHWAEILKLSSASPIIGIGLATTEEITEDEKQPHNDFVRTFVEMGFVGFVAYVALLLALLRLGWTAATKPPVGSLERSVGIGFLGCAVAFVAVSLVANLISNVVTLWYFLAFAAAASAVVLRGGGARARERDVSRASIEGAPT